MIACYGCRPTLPVDTIAGVTWMKLNVHIDCKCDNVCFSSQCMVLQHLGQFITGCSDAPNTLKYSLLLLGCCFFCFVGVVFFGADCNETKVVARGGVS